MGRASGITGQITLPKDAFTSVVGGLRGLSKNQGSLSVATSDEGISDSPFADDPIVALRRISLVHHMRGRNFPQTVVELVDESEAYDLPYLETKYSLTERLEVGESICEKDLEALVEQGLCQKKYKTCYSQKTRSFSQKIAVYSLFSVFLWPETHRACYLQWKKNS